MKQSIFSLILACLMVAGAQAGSPFTEYKKEIRKDYKVNPEALVGVTNKYGKIEVHSWDKDVASFQIIIRVTADNPGRADEIFKTISIHFSNHPNEVRAITEIENKPKSVWSWWWSSGEKSEFAIDYVVYIPTRARLDLNNKYGDILIDQLANTANIELKYGNLQMVGSSEDVGFILGYSKARIGTTRAVSGEAKYSTLKFATTRDMDWDSKYSKVEVGEARRMNINSKYDTYVIGRVNSINNEGKYDDFEIVEVDEVFTRTAYTDWEIRRLNKMADVEMKYGEMKIYKLAPECESIRFVGNYAHLSVTPDPWMDFRADIHSSYGNIKTPTSFTVSRDIKEGQTQQFSGYVRSPNAKMVLTADISYGGITIR